MAGCAASAAPDRRTSVDPAGSSCGTADPSAAVMPWLPVSDDVIVGPGAALAVVPWLPVSDDVMVGLWKRAAAAASGDAAQPEGIGWWL